MAAALGIILALLLGTIGGAILTAVQYMNSKPLRDFWNDLAEDDDEWI